MPYRKQPRHPVEHVANVLAVTHVNRAGMQCHAHS
jgi:hypothetical protein